MQWHFSSKRPSDKTRDPVVGEFFSSDAIKDAGEALVREAIQNSLDARIDRGAGNVRIRIYLSGDSKALAANEKNPGDIMLLHFSQDLVTGAPGGPYPHVSPVGDSTHTTRK